ncbi:MAG: ribonuclease P protein component [Clostridiales Family XIII bacterium]|jgi:ribonuclease P protein component|nr:ribonuclease P protein component [Clostridiales Family XIII bacterium]
MREPDVLRDKRDFTRLYKKGKAVHEKYIVLFYIENGLDYNRRAFLASKKVGNAVHRNRARRLMKEAFRLHADKVKIGVDVLFIARNTIDGKKMQDVCECELRALKKSKLIK